jgi:mRNA interferase RelE/StbE
MVYLIKYTPSARKNLLAFDRAIHKRIVKSIHNLADNLRPAGCRKLKGRDAWRIRIGGYRVVYEIHDGVLIVLVVRVAHRKKTYKS